MPACSRAGDVPWSGSSDLSAFTKQTGSLGASPWTETLGTQVIFRNDEGVLIKNLGIGVPDGIPCAEFDFTLKYRMPFESPLRSVTLNNAQISDIIFDYGILESVTVDYKGSDPTFTLYESDFRFEISNDVYEYIFIETTTPFEDIAPSIDKYLRAELRDFTSIVRYAYMFQNVTTGDIFFDSNTVGTESLAELTSGPIEQPLDLNGYIRVGVMYNKDSGVQGMSCVTLREYG